MMWQQWLDEQFARLGMPMISDSEMRRAAEQLGYKWIEVDVNSTAAILRCGSDTVWFSNLIITYRTVIKENEATFVPHLQGEPHEGSWDESAIAQIVSDILRLVGYHPVTVPLPIYRSAISQN